MGQGAEDALRKAAAEVTAGTEPREGIGVSIRVPWGQLGLLRPSLAKRFIYFTSSYSNPAR